MTSEFKSFVLDSDQILKSAKAGGKTEVFPPIDLFHICEIARMLPLQQVPSRVLFEGWNTNQKRRDRISENEGIGSSRA